MGQACTRQRSLGACRGEEEASRTSGPQTAFESLREKNCMYDAANAREHKGSCHSDARGGAERDTFKAGAASVEDTSANAGGAPPASRLLEGEKQVNTRKKWKPASPSLVYCLINSLADRHLAVVFDCRERDKYEVNHLHYAICPWRSSHDVAAVLEYFEKHGTPLVTNADLFKQKKGLAPPVSKSAAANPAARSPRFVFPAFLSRTQTLPSSAKKSEKKRDSKGENTPPSPLVFTPQAGASDSTAPSLVALNSQRSQTQREEESGKSGDKECGNRRDTLAEPGEPETSGADAEAPTAENHGLGVHTVLADRATVAAAAMKRASPSRCLSGRDDLSSSLPSTSQIAPEDAEQKEAEEKAEEAADVEPEEEPKRLAALKTWLRTVCKFRTVIMYGEGDDDPLLLMFLNCLLDSGARFKAAIVLAGGISSLGWRYSPLSITSDLLLPGPVELIPPLREKQTSSFLPNTGAAASARRAPSKLQEFREGGPRASLARLTTRRMLARSATGAPVSRFSVFVASSPSLIHENEDILRHFGIKVVVNLTSTPCPLPAADWGAQTPSPSRIRQLLTAAPAPAGFEVHDLPFNDVGSFPFEAAASLLRHAKERDVAALVYDYRGENTVAPGVVAWFLVDEGHGVIQTLNHIRLRLPLAEMNPTLVSELHQHAETLSKVPAGAAPAPPPTAGAARKGKHFAFHVLPFPPAGKKEAARAEAQLGGIKEAHTEQTQPRTEAGEAETLQKGGEDSHATPATSGAADASPLLRPGSSLLTLGSLYTDGSPVNPLPAVQEKQEELPSDATLEETVSRLLATWFPSVAPAAAELSIATLRRILSNILQHPTDEKFRRLKLTNKRVQESVGAHPELLKILFIGGFVRHPSDALIEFPCDAPLQKLSDLLVFLPSSTLSFSSADGCARDACSSLLSGSPSTLGRSLAPSSFVHTSEENRDLTSSFSSAPLCGSASVSSSLPSSLPHSSLPLTSSLSNGSLPLRSPHASSRLGASVSGGAGGLTGKGSKNMAR
ncbi:UNVERIFIED_CONTAM: PUB domain-containing protein [Hammondia hammondi]|eukprot:XP_008882506.1 PUB domain-containing protein [Hammondia hammondi]